MSELDLPQITFTRYLELLRRRWWQVIPITILGLIAGAVAAFLIPRYYVAVTKFTFQGGGALDPNAEDPLYGRVTNAAIEVRGLVPEAITELAWLEASDQDEERRSEFIQAVKDRVSVYIPMALTPKAVNKLNLELYYKDTDGKRAAALANKLREVWFEDIRETVEDRARSELDDANRRVKSAEDAKRNAETELHNHMVQHGLNPNDFDPDRPGGGSRSHPVYLEKAELNRDRSTYIRAIAGLERHIEALDAELSSGTIEPKIREAVDAVVDPELEQRYQDLLAERREAQRRVETTRESNPRRTVFEMQLEAVERELREVESKRQAAQTVEIDNPRYLAKREELASMRAEIEKFERLVKVADEQLAKVDATIKKLPEIESARQQFRRTVERREEELKAIRTEWREVEKRYAALTMSRKLYVTEEAIVPPRPTDPNIVLVALAGSLIGLATAIGLILLLDFMQSAFKSVDDVERALPVPVLGALAHLETFEERSKGVAHRRRVSLAAGVFLFLSLSVVTIYYVDPTRLPKPVTQALDVLLGAPPAAPIEDN